MKTETLIFIATAATLAALALTGRKTLTLKTSETGRQFIRDFEGLKLTSSPDPAGFMDIGYGHRLQPGEFEVFKNIDLATAERLLDQDIKAAENCVNGNVKVLLTQGQFDALVSFVYNLGCKAFRDSTLLSKLNTGDYNGAAAELPRWTFAAGKQLAGLVRRREAEKKVFMA